MTDILTSPWLQFSSIFPVITSKVLLFIPAPHVDFNNFLLLSTDSQGSNYAERRCISHDWLQRPSQQYLFHVPLTSFFSSSYTFLHSTIYQLYIAYLKGKYIFLSSSVINPFISIHFNAYLLSGFQCNMSVGPLAQSPRPGIQSTLPRWAAPLM